MARNSKIEPDGSFYIGKQRHEIPETFSDHQVHSFRTLLEPIPDQPSGTVLTAGQRRRQEQYLMRRALAAVIPGLSLTALQKLSMTSVRSIYEWVVQHRPELAGAFEIAVK